MLKITINKARYQISRKLALNKMIHRQNVTNIMRRQHVSNIMYIIFTTISKIYKPVAA